MITFSQAFRRHAMLRHRVTDERRETALELWSAVTGAGAVSSLIGHAVADTVPTDYAVLLATDDIAAAFAVAVLLDAVVQASTPTTPREARSIAHAGWAAFRELADQGGHLIHGTGADASSAWPVIKELQSMGCRRQKQLEAIATLAGRMMQALRGAKHRRVENVPEQIVGVKTGSDVQALLPYEYALLALPATRLDATRRLLERQTAQYAKAGTEKLARGPLALVIDESGSMEDVGGTPGPNTWAKAAATALTRLAWEDKRDVVWVHFSTAVRVSVLKPNDSGALLRAQRSFLDGGTDIGCALEQAAAEIRALARRGRSGADAVLISDGGDEHGYVDAGLRALDAVDARLFSVAIGPEFRGPLKDCAARYVNLSEHDFTGTDGALAVGAAVGA